MNESEILKRIKELQNDTKFTFKLTEDIIDIVYRTAIKDSENNDNNNIEELTNEVNTWKDMYNKLLNDKNIIVKSSKDLNKKFGTNNYINDTQKIKHDIYYEILKYIDTHNDLMDVYMYVKEKCIDTGNNKLNKFNYEVY